SGTNCAFADRAAPGGPSSGRPRQSSAARAPAGRGRIRYPIRGRTHHRRRSAWRPLSIRRPGAARGPCRCSPVSAPTDGLVCCGGIVLRARFLALRHSQEVIPVLHTQDVAGMASTEEEEARDEAAGPGEEIEQFLAREVVPSPAGFGEFEAVQVP